MIPVPKYAIGDVVFYATTHQTSEKLPCPDCLDTREWTVTTKTGEAFAVTCQRCVDSYRRAETPSLTRNTWKPSTRTLTIGKITIEAGHTDVRRDPITYMCHETGVGSGSVYYESNLFATEAEALVAGQAEADALKAQWEAKAEPKRLLEISRLTFRDVFAADQAHTVWSACYHFRQLREKVEEWLEDNNEFQPTDSQDEAIRDALSSLEWHDSPQQNPVIRLVLAARAGGPELADALKAFEFIRAPKQEEIGAL
jgi:hypothetical protein